jgi:hypothetical protein
MVADEWEYSRAGIKQPCDQHFAAQQDVTVERSEHAC